MSRDPKNLFNPTFFAAFANNVPVAHPPTPDVLTPNRTFARDVYTGLNVDMPNGTGNPIPLEFWGFKDPLNPATFPSETIRLVEGDLFHCTLNATPEFPYHSLVRAGAHLHERRGRPHFF